MERSISWLRGEALGEDERRHALAHSLGVPFVELERADISPEALVIIPEPLSRDYNIVAYRFAPDEGHSVPSVEVALLNLDDLDRLDFLRSRYKLLPRLTSRESLTRGLVRYQRHLKDMYGAALERADSPHLLDTLLKHALHSSASDIHLQSEKSGLLVRYRIHGSLKNAMTLPAAAGANVLSKLRSLANIPAGSLPREGRIRVDLGSGEDISVQVVSVPIVHGEKLVLRIAREHSRGFTLESLGLHGEALERVHKTLLHRRGLVLVAGSSGAGKATALYTMLDLLNTPELSLATVEREIKHVLPRAAQTESTNGLSVAAALRAALRTDCDVVMVSHIEDKETATLALEAAARGVLVLAGIEALDAELGIEKFKEFDIDRAKFDRAFALALGVSVVQRLGDKQFSHQRKLTRAQADALESRADFGTVLSVLKEEGKVEKETPWKDVQFSSAVGSSEQPDGYKGLIGLQEVIAPEGRVGLSLPEDGLYKAALGLTSLEEVKKALF